MLPRKMKSGETMKQLRLRLETLFVIISILLIAAAFIVQELINPDSAWIAYLFGLSFLIGGFFKAKEGIEATIENKYLNVEILMILAALGAFVVGEFQEGAILIFIFAVSGLLETYTTARSEKELTSLLNLAPETAILVVDGVEQEVLVSDVKIGDLVVVKVGQLIPVDGIVERGETSVDEAAITGEFVPVSKEVGSDVFAGSINIEATIYVKTTVDPSASVVKKIVDFVKNAQESETKSQTLLNRIERVYVYVVILIAILFMILPPLVNWLSWEDAFYRGIIVLVVGSPCALMASISPAILASLSNAAKKRVLIKGGEPLEHLLHTKAVVFDKTGTITTGEPHVISMTSFSDEELSIIVSMEQQSSHPLAKAITSHLEDSVKRNIDTKELPGRGMTAVVGSDTYEIGRFDHEITVSLENGKGLTLVHVFKNKKHIGSIGLQDQIREGVSQVMKDLKALGIHTVMLTGDNQDAARRISQEVGIAGCFAGLLPDQKVEKLREIKQEYGSILMVGDGINDAPALAIADIGIAMGTATDVSLETADIVLMNNKLGNVLDIMKLAKRMRRITLQNVVFSISVIALLMISNVFGVVELPAGVVAHEGSTVLVIINSLRLLVK